jgi:tungstate transport system permease protein
MGLVAAVAAGFGAVISEVGAVMMVGGNLAGDTRVMTTAIVQYTRMGRYGAALALGVVLLLLIILVNVALTGLQTSADRWEGDAR